MLGASAALSNSAVAWSVPQSKPLFGSWVHSAVAALVPPIAWMAARGGGPGAVSPLHLLPLAVHCFVVAAPVIVAVAAWALLPAAVFTALAAAAAALLAAYLAQQTRLAAPATRPRGGPLARKRVAVLGAGPVGLTCLKELLAEGHEVQCFDAAGRLGGVYARCYDSARLTSSPFVTAFSDHAPPLDEHRHWTATAYVAYLETYAERFGLKQHVQFDSRVVAVRKEKSGKWCVVVSGAAGERAAGGFDSVAVCTGPNGHPNTACFEGQESFPGEIVHSSEYRNAEHLAGKRVLVVGLGETAADVAAEVAAVAPGALLSVRVGGAFVIPRVNGLTGVNNDYDSNRLRYSVPKLWHNLTAYLCAGLNHLVGALGAGAAVRFRLLRESGKGAFSQFATKSDEFVPAIASGALRIKPGVRRIMGSTVEFSDGSCEDVDAIVLCTGYGAKTGVMFGYFDQQELGVHCLTDLYKYCFPTNHAPGSVAFLGFARPHIGSIPMMAELQARLFAQVCSGRRALPSDAEMQNDIAAARRRWAADFGEGRLKTMVNWIQYCDSIAALGGCRPDPGLWVSDPALALKLVTGPFTSFHFRLSGHGACPEEARRVVMGLPHGMRKRDMLWFASLHAAAAVARLGGLRSSISENSCSMY